MKNVIIKWLLKLDDDGEVVHSIREVSKFAPVNRVLEDVGFYELDSLTVNNKDYLVVVKREEYKTTKSIILVARIHKGKNSEGIIDMSEDDLDSLEALAYRFLRKKHSWNGIRR